MKSAKIMIAGTQSGVGKTTITMGVLASLAKTMTVQPFKVGPDYIDPAYHTYITGRSCKNLDNYILSNESVQHLFVKSMKDADIGVIEGVMGLYDGAGEVTDIGSSASIAKALSCPVLLVIDGSGISTSIAAIVKGFTEFDPQVLIKGVILNRVNSKRHYQLLKEAIESHTSVTCYGYLPKKERGNIKSRHLGLMPSYELEDLDEKLKVLTEDIQETMDIQGIQQLAKASATEVEDNHQPIQANFEGIHIGIAYDEAFNFYYQDNLDLLRSRGATLHMFSPVKDKTLPKPLHFLYFGGGFPESFAKELEANHEMKGAIVQALDSGMPYLAECGGLMYLNQTLIDFDGNAYTMVGWFQGKCRMTQGLKRFGYKELVLKEDSLLGPKGFTTRVHEFHHSEAEEMVEETNFELKKIRKGQVLATHSCGYVKGNGVAGYPHFYFYSDLSMVEHILGKAKAYKLRRGE